MDTHPIQGLMKTAMESIKQMVEVNTIVGNPIETPDGSVIIPISRVSFGFCAGGSEFSSSGNVTAQSSQSLPFGGGSGAGASVQPVAFLVVNNEQVRLMTVDDYQILDKIVDVAPQVMENLKKIIKNYQDPQQDPQQNPQNQQSPPRGQF